MRPLCLKTKMVLYILVFFVVMAPMVVYLSIHHFRAAIENSIEQQQFMLVTRIADELDQKIRFAQDALSSTARQITPKVTASPERAEEFLYNNLSLISIFDNGVFLFDPKGRMIAETATSPSRTGMDFSFREYIQRTLISKKPEISPPFTSSMPHRHPAVMFTSPIFDSSGSILAILGGSIDLLKSNFLGSLSQAKVGNEGYYYLSTADRRIIMHPDKSRIMSIAEPLKNILYDKAIQGFEGAGETVTLSGMHTISAFKRLANVDWILSANFPEKEAMAPIHKATYYAWALAFLGTIMTVGVFWLITRQLIAPLLSITEQIRKIHSNDGHSRQVEVSTNDEIMELATAFNRLMAGLEEKEQKLSRMNEDLEQRVVERTSELEKTNCALLSEIQKYSDAQEEITCLNEDLNRRAIALELINKELECFSYSVSHDLRAPVRHIKAFSDILIENYTHKLDLEGNSILKRISDASRKIEFLINEILGLSRVARIEISRTSINLSNIVTDVANVLKETDPDRKVELSITDNVTVNGDPALMYIVMQNLIENAWKYSSRNERTMIKFGVIEDDYEMSGYGKTYYVKDNGIGFDMKYKDKIFEVFQRLHSSSEFEGSGIGLATVQRIIRRHGGKIWAESTMSEGATFYFTLAESS